MGAARDPRDEQTEVLSSLLNAERPRRAEDPAKGLTSSAPEVNAYKFRSGDVVETLEKLFLRCRILSSLLNASLCMCRPSQGEMWPMCPLMSVVGRANIEAVMAKRGRDGQESLESLGATP